MCIPAEAPGDALASVAENAEAGTWTPVVAAVGAATEIDGAHLDDCTTVLGMAGLHRDVRAWLDASPVNVAYHQYVFPAETVASLFVWYVALPLLTIAVPT
jgi:hypothetical protein